MFHKGRGLLLKLKQITAGRDFHPTPRTMFFDLLKGVNQCVYPILHESEGTTLFIY